MFAKEIKRGDLVVNLNNSFAKLFSKPLTKESVAGTRKYLGILSGVGLVIQTYGSDVMVMCDSSVGWCYVGNVRVVG